MYNTDFFAEVDLSNMGRGDSFAVKDILFTINTILESHNLVQYVLVFNNKLEQMYLIWEPAVGKVVGVDFNV